MNINFSIPVTLFDYQQSDNPLYSLAKLKIFYIGMTADKRLFTKKFSDELLKTLPYVPVVGYYDYDSEDFKGHHSEVQYIYGIVPESTKLEYIVEDNREYAVCDVILYTGRQDETGEIAQKIVGKSHSLELNPEDTTYEVHRDAKGSILNIEFKTGSLVGLSVLGDNETPAFTGSEFFTKNDNLDYILEGFKTVWKNFVDNNQLERGNNMSIIDTGTVDTELTNITTEVVGSKSTETVESELTSATEVITSEQKFIDFMKQTYEELEEEVLSKFYEFFGEDVFVIQWSSVENIIVFVDFMDYKYYRVSFNKNEESNELIFSDKVSVKMRFLTEEEINTIFIKTPTDVNIQTEESNNSDEGTITEETIFSSETEPHEGDTNDEEGTNIEISNKAEEAEENEGKFKEQSSSTTLTDSERTELETFRKERKLNLIDSFTELDKIFIEKLKKEIDNYTYDELDIILSKEFTKEVKKQSQSTKTVLSPLMYRSTKTNNKSEIQVLVDTYKDK